MTPVDGVVETLTSRVPGDIAASEYLLSRQLQIGVQPVHASAADLAACIVARSVVRERSLCAGIVSPRGKSHLPLIVGLYLAAFRSFGFLPGSVTIASRDSSLREKAATIHWSRPGAKVPPMGRLSAITLSDGRVRAAVRPLSGRGVRGLSQADRYLLFQLPNVMPPVALNVISAAVIDAVGSSASSWQASFERFRTLETRQVWLGELGDPAFEAFCEECSIPLLRLDWSLLASLVRELGVGESSVASTSLCSRARRTPQVGYRVVQHEDIDGELREVISRLESMRALCPGSRRPELFDHAYSLASLFGRLACPLGFRDEATAMSPFERSSEWVLRYLDSSPSGFAPEWRRAFEAHWPAVKGALRRLAQQLADPDVSPKWWALYDSIEQCRQSGVRLRVLCQTRSEKTATRRALLEWGLVAEEELSRNLFVEAFGDERWPHGEEDATIVLLLAPPGGWRSSVLLSGEVGRQEVLCYPFQATGLRRRLGWAFRTHSAENAAALEAMGLGSRTESAEVESGPSVVQLEAVQLSGWDQRPSREAQDAFEVPDAVAEFWARAAELTDPDQEPGRGDGDVLSEDPAVVGGDEPSVAVRFEEGVTIDFPEQVACDVLKASPGKDPVVVEVLPSKLEPGMRVVVLPGSERGGLLAELLAVWDERFHLPKKHYEGMYERALSAAVERNGVDQVARAVVRTPDAVRGWVRGDAHPGNWATMRKLLELSGDQQAILNARVIYDLFSTMGGAHRLIGRILNEAVAEVVVFDTEGPSIRRLERMVGQDLQDLMSAVLVLTVAQAAHETVHVPRRQLGQVREAGG